LSGLLKNLEEKLTKKIEERMGPLAAKMDEMIKVLKQIEENTRKG